MTDTLTTDEAEYTRGTRQLGKEEAQNRAVVLDYYGKLIGNWDFDAARVHLGSHFIQHNPAIPDGLDGLEAWVRNIPTSIAAQMRHRIARVLVDGDMVVLHTRLSVPGAPDTVIADFFRLEDGKVVEHWDVIQNVPDEAMHTNGII